MPAVKKKRNPTERVGIVIYMTEAERRCLHCAAAHFIGRNGRRMSAGEFSVKAVNDRIAAAAKDDLGEIGYEKQHKENFVRGNLLAYCNYSERQRFHSVAQKNNLSTSDLLLRVAMNEAMRVNAVSMSPIG